MPVPYVDWPRRGRIAADRSSSARLPPRSRAAAASRCVGSPLNSRKVIVKSLPFSAPRFSLRRWRAAATTSKPSPATPTHASPIAERAGTVNDCSATASRSFRPAKPTSRGWSFASRASCFATHRVFAPRLRTLQQQMVAVAVRLQPSHSLHDESLRARRAAARGPPDRRARTAARPSLRGHSRSLSSGRLLDQDDRLARQPFAATDEAQTFASSSP